MCLRHELLGIRVSVAEVIATAHRVADAEQHQLIAQGEKVGQEISSPMATLGG